MSLHANALDTLRRWSAPTKVQKVLQRDYVELLEQGRRCLSRDFAPGHLTASAVVLSHDLTRVALTLHGIVGAWLQFGGHLEDEDRSLVEAAQREVREEAGIDVALRPVPIHLDIHPITCRGYSSPTRHLDVRFVGVAREGATLVVSEESNAVSWFGVDELPPVFPEVAELIQLGLEAAKTGAFTTSTLPQ